MSVIVVLILLVAAVLLYVAMEKATWAYRLRDNKRYKVGALYAVAGLLVMGFALWLGPIGQ